MLTKEEEKKLVQMCISGDKKAWDNFVSQFCKLIYNFIHKTLKRYGCQNNPDLVEELFQDIFLGLLKDDYSKLRNFGWKNDCSISTWLGVVATNLVMDSLRKDSRYKHKFESLDATAESADGEMTSLANKAHNDRSFVEDLYSQENLELLNSLIDKLQPSDQLLFTLIYKDGLALEEVAQHMHKSIDALYMHKKRVLDKLKAEFEKNNVRF